MTDWPKVWAEAERRYAGAVCMGLLLGEVEQVVFDVSRWLRCRRRRQAATAAVQSSKTP